MTLKLRATHLAPPAYAHLKEYVVLSGNWQIGQISEERAGKGHGRADYMTIVMRRRPPTATKPMPVSGALVITIAMPPTKANPPTTAIAARLT